MRVVIIRRSTIIITIIQDTTQYLDHTLHSTTPPQDTINQSPNNRSESTPITFEAAAEKMCEREIAFFFKVKIIVINKMIIYMYR